MIVTSLSALVVAQETQRNHDSIYIINQRSMGDKLRGSNTFRPSNLGTAPGYGKRGNPFEFAITANGGQRSSLSPTARDSLPKRSVYIMYMILFNII